MLPSGLPVPFFPPAPFLAGGLAPLELAPPRLPAPDALVTALLLAPPSFPSPLLAVPPGVVAPAAAAAAPSVEVMLLPTSLVLRATDAVTACPPVDEAREAELLRGAVTLLLAWGRELVMEEENPGGGGTGAGAGVGMEARLGSEAELGLILPAGSSPPSAVAPATASAAPGAAPGSPAATAAAADAIP